jgi:hypothetical protein
VRESGHFTNVGNDGFSSKILDECLHFRKVLKTSLVGMEELGRFWMTDSLACLGSIPATRQEKLDSLRTCLGGDGVHLTEQGRFHLFNNLAKTVLSLKDGSIGKPPKPAEAAACSLISGRKYYWRGFESDRGSTSRPLGWARRRKGRERPRAGQRQQRPAAGDAVQLPGGRHGRRWRCGKERGERRHLVHFFLFPFDFTLPLLNFDLRTAAYFLSSSHSHI